MSVTMLSVLDLARFDLNDAKVVTSTSTDDSACRTPDSELMKYANDGIANALVVRPDLNFGSYAGTFTDLTTASAFPLPMEYRSPIADFIVMCAEKSDDAFAAEQKAIQGLKLYLSGMGLK
jgi:hypothetical protein